MATRKQAFTMRMQPENLEKIKEIANNNRRSVANQIEYIIEQYIMQFERSKNSAIKTNYVQQNGDNNETLIMQ